MSEVKFALGKLVNSVNANLIAEMERRKKCIFYLYEMNLEKSVSGFFLTMVV